MILKILRSLFGTRNERLLKKCRAVVQKINALEPSIHALTDAQLRAKTEEFKKRYQAGETLDALLPEAFAVTREAGLRTLGMRHFDVQLIGGMILHNGKIAEMRTGEGKTFVATLPVYLNALTGKGVHLVTVNDYLANRDAEWMKPLYEFLGLTVGVNLSTLNPEEKQKAYAADITYGTNNEFGFDYLRDNMVFDLKNRVQRGLHYCIVDEVDSILIDEARTPLIISGQVSGSSALYEKINKLIPQLKRQMVLEDPTKPEPIPESERGDYTVDEKTKQIQLTELGHQKIETLFTQTGLLASGSSLYDISNLNLMHYLLACLRAHALYHRDVDYIVRNGEVVIVDEHTGRLMEGRRWSEGLHQAVEAKEGARIQLENQTLATITFQNYFRLYEKLSGMTGTADTEAFELQKIYGLEVVVIPTNKPMIRNDRSDKIYLTAAKKYEAVLEEIKQARARQQPVLVGTASIESSELVSHMLKKEKIPHEVLNAKQHQREALIIAEAGKPGAVTIATNMAGRGTDITLGGNVSQEIALHKDATPEQIEALKKDWEKRHETVIQAGGLFVLGTERHESRRIDNQLRGRSGRQGDPGVSQFYLSMQDNLLRIFAAERMTNLMRKLGVKEDDVIEHPWINRAIENAQKRVEGMNFDIRKQLLEYDDVANDQRRVVYEQRLWLLASENIADFVSNLREEVFNNVINEFVPEHSMEEMWNIPGLENTLRDEFLLPLPLSEWLVQDENLHEETLRSKILAEANAFYAAKEAKMGSAVLRSLEKNLMTQILDTHWREHLSAMDHLRQGIHLRGYAQKNPVQEYKRESFNLFTNMWDQLKREFIATLNKVEVRAAEPLDLPAPDAKEKLQFQHQEIKSFSTSESPPPPAAEKETPAKPETVMRGERKVGRNELCPCGSGKKYKQCHGKFE